MKRAQAERVLEKGGEPVMELARVVKEKALTQGITQGITQAKKEFDQNLLADDFIHTKLLKGKNLENS